jgi:hypothetical protein
MAFAAPRGAYTIIPSSTGPIDTESTAFLAGNHPNLAQTIEIRVRKGLTRGISGPNTGYFPEERRPKLAGVSREAESEVAGSLVISSRQDVERLLQLEKKFWTGMPGTLVVISSRRHSWLSLRQPVCSAGTKR